MIWSHNPGNSATTIDDPVIVGRRDTMQLVTVLAGGARMEAGAITSDGFQVCEIHLPKV